MDYLIHTPTQLGKALRAHRKSLGFNQTKAGTTVGLAQNTVSKLETDPGSSSIDSLLNLAAALNLELVLRPKTRTPPGTSGLEW